jgi:hypothetical protein
MLKEFKYLFSENGPRASSSSVLKHYLKNFDSSSIDHNYMKEQAIMYFIHGPAWRQDDFLLERSWLKGFEAACSQAGRHFTLRFTIDQHCSSKLDAGLPKDEE